MEAPKSDADLALLRRAAAGDNRAFHELVERHEDRLYRLALSMVGNASDAEDVLQEALIGAYKGARKFEGRSSVRTWLTGIVAMQAAKHWRDRKRRTMQSIESTPTTPAVAGGGVSVEQRMDLHTAIHKLSPEHREVIALREFEQLSYDEIASVLGVPIGTIESRLSRARGELRKHLGAYRP